MIKLKTLIKKLLTEETVIVILQTIQSFILTTFVRMCSQNSTPNIYIPMYLAVVFFFATQKLGMKYWDDLDQLTPRHIKWALISIFVTGLYFIIGNPILSTIISLYLAVCKVALFHGKEEKSMTWSDLKKILKIA